MEKIKLGSQFFRDDGFVDKGVDYSNSIQEKWIHKQIVSKVGDSEDDFLIEEKPFLVEKVDLHKRINEEAKVTDLKSLLAQLLRTNGCITGDEPELNARSGFYGDVTKIQNVIDHRGSFVSPDEIKSTLPDELKAISTETLSKMSDSDILAYMAQVRKQAKDLASSKEESSKKEGD